MTRLRRGDGRERNGHGDWVSDGRKAFEPHRSWRNHDHFWRLLLIFSIRQLPSHRRLIFASFTKSITIWYFLQTFLLISNSFVVVRSRWVASKYIYLKVYSIMTLKRWLLFLVDFIFHVLVSFVPHHHSFTKLIKVLYLVKLTKKKKLLKKLIKLTKFCFFRNNYWMFLIYNSDNPDHKHMFWRKTMNLYKNSNIWSNNTILLVFCFFWEKNYMHLKHLVFIRVVLRPNAIIKCKQIGQMIIINSHFPKLYRHRRPKINRDVQYMYVRNIKNGSNGKNW